MTLLRLVAVVSWTVAAIYLGLWLLIAARYYRLSANAQQTAGTVVALRPEEHRTVRYSYEVAGTTYTATDRSGKGGTPRIEDLSVGARVAVFYNPANPEDACLGDPARIYSDEARGAFFGALWLGSFVGFGLWWRWGQNRARRAASLASGTAPPN